MFERSHCSAAAALLFAAVVVPTTTKAADFPAKASAPTAVEVPFFTINDNRLTYAYQFTATDPGATAKTAKQVYAFTHFDAWAYGTNLFNAIVLKSDHADPSAPCLKAFQGCAGATEMVGNIRSTFGFNQLFDTKAFSVGPLHNVSFEVGADIETENNAVAPNKRAVVAGLQFAFDLPYKGFFNVAPLYYQEWGHNAFLSSTFLNSIGVAGGIPDGEVAFRGTWAVETNYYMDFGFLPESLRYFAISGRAVWIGPKGTGTSLVIPGNIPTVVEFNSEPIRLTFDASKAAWGPKYSHFVDVWVAYRYWQNKFGLDHTLRSACLGATAGSCTESSLYSGVTVKF